MNQLYRTSIELRNPKPVYVIMLWYQTPHDDGRLLAVADMFTYYSQ